MNIGWNRQSCLCYEWSKLLVKFDGVTTSWVQSYYSVYGGTTTAQYPMYGTGAAGGMSMITGAAAAAAAFYPYLNFGEGSGGATTGYTSSHGYGIQYPHHLFQYSAAINSTGAFPQHYGAAAGTPISLAPTTPPLQSGLYTTLATRSSPFFWPF